MKFKEKHYPYVKVKEKLPNARFTSILPTTSCTMPEFIEIMCSYGDVSTATARLFLNEFTNEFRECIENCKRLNFKFGTFVGGCEDKRIPQAYSWMPQLKKAGIYRGILFYEFDKTLRQGYVHRLEESRMYHNGIKRMAVRPFGETHPRLKVINYDTYIPGLEGLIRREEFIDILARRCKITHNLSSRLLEALELTIIELIRSNKYFVFTKTCIIGGYPRIASAAEATKAGFRGEEYIVKDFCPFCRVTTRYNGLYLGKWLDPSFLEEEAQVYNG